MKEGVRTRRTVQIDGGSGCVSRMTIKEAGEVGHNAIVKALFAILKSSDFILEAIASNPHTVKGGF